MATRMIDIPGNGTFEVPAHVSRVDTVKGGASGRPAVAWQGWQVRWPGFSRFFPDAPHGGVAAALQAAADYVAQHYPGSGEQWNREVC